MARTYFVLIVTRGRVVEKTVYVCERSFLKALEYCRDFLNDTIPKYSHLFNRPYTVEAFEINREKGMRVVDFLEYKP